MKSSIGLLKLSFILIPLIFLATGCKKNDCTQTYTIYTPVYRTTAQVRENVKSNGAKPVKNPGKMFVFGSYIFLNEMDKGIHIIDNSNPSSPLNKFFIDIPGNLDLAVSGNSLFVDCYTDMLTIDIGDPSSIVVKKVTENAFPFRKYSNGFIADNSKVIVDWIKRDTTVKVECARGGALDAAMPSASLASPTGISGSMARFALLDDYLYTVTDHAINVFNISQPFQPVFSNVVNVNASVETLYPFKKNLFIGSTTGMFIYGTANPAKPNLVGSFSHVRTCDPVIADDKFAYVTLRSGTMCGGFTNQLDVLNIENLYNPVPVKSYPLVNPHGLSKDGNTLFICDGAAGLRVFDASTASDIRLLVTVTMAPTYDVIASNGLALVVARDGLYEYDYSNVKVPRLLSKISYEN